MLCASCRRQLARATVCATCGTPVPGASAPLELVLADGTRVVLVGELTIGRSRASSLWLDDPSVSRDHARICAGTGAPVLEDARSSYGTYVDGAPVAEPVALRDRSLIRVGNQRLEVQAHRDEQAAGRTLVVPAGASVLLSAVGSASLQPAQTAHGQRPRLRSGYALKRLDASEDGRRWVVRDLRGERFLSVSDNDAQLLVLLDGSRSLADLVAEAESAFGQLGAVRLARLLADLGEREMLAGVQAGASDEPQPRVAGRLQHLLRTRERSIDGVGAFFDWVYRHGGWLAFTRTALVALAAIAIAGLGAWIALMVGRYGTPFVVAERLVLGGLVFLAGRGLLVVFHELAHGLAMESVGRRVQRAGVKSIFIFPYAFVDTSEVWFESRRRRVAVSAAGPLSDVTLAGSFAILCLLLAPGTIRDVAFQVAFAGYVAAFFNLNPFLERDGYHMLVDRLGVPRLRARAREALRRRLSGEPAHDVEPAIGRYAVAGLAWSLAAAGIVIAMSLRFAPIMTQYAPPLVVWIVLATLWAALFVPVVLLVGPPLWARVRRRQSSQTEDS